MIDGTILENITLGIPKQKIDWQLLEYALLQSCSSKFVSNFVEGVDYFIGENGNRLSGGQRQRLIIARALYAKRDILVFDEATSALDEETETMILSELKNIVPKKTIIIISHKASIENFCDRVFAIENKRIQKKDI